LANYLNSWVNNLNIWYPLLLLLWMIENTKTKQK